MHFSIRFEHWTDAMGSAWMACIWRLGAGTLGARAELVGSGINADRSVALQLALRRARMLLASENA